MRAVSPASSRSWAACPYCGEHEDAAAWSDKEPLRAAAVTELKPAAKRPRSRTKRPPAKTESAL